MCRRQDKTYGNPPKPKGAHIVLNLSENLLEDGMFF
jgi:hypothetical protein